MDTDGKRCLQYESKEAREPAIRAAEASSKESHLARLVLQAESRVRFVPAE